MKKILCLIAILATVFNACNNTEEKSENSDSTNLAQLDNVYSVDDFDSIASNFVDKEIQVEGIVDHVCKHSGKRLFIVGDQGEMHVDGEEKFHDSLNGSKIIVTGIVREFKIDEAYCLQQEKDNINSHSKGETEKELFERKKKMVAEYRDSMKAAKSDHLSFYTLEYKSLKATN